MCTPVLTIIAYFRWTFEYPEDMAGIFKEISTYHVDYYWSPLTVLISTVSLAGGASLGPEQALVYYTCLCAVAVLTSHTIVVAGTYSAVLYITDAH